MFLWWASLASVSCGVSLALEAADMFLRYTSLTSDPCGVSLALNRALFVAAEDTLPIGTLFWVACRENLQWKHVQKYGLERVQMRENGMCSNREERNVRII